MTDLKAISTRKKARELANNAEKEVDLSGVEFVSSAFAHELVIQCEDQDLEMVNVSSEVERMFDVVRDR